MNIDVAAVCKLDKIGAVLDRSMLNFFSKLLVYKSATLLKFQPQVCRSRQTSANWWPRSPNLERLVLGCVDADFSRIGIIFMLQHLESSTRLARFLMHLWIPIWKPRNLSKLKYFAKCRSKNQRCWRTFRRIFVEFGRHLPNDESTLNNLSLTALRPGALTDIWVAWTISITDSLLR